MSALAKSQKKKAEAMMADADKLLNKRSWFGNKERDQEEAAETYLQAANAFKVGGMLQESGDTYVKAAQIYEKLNSGTEAAKAYSSAAACYKKCNAVDAVAAYQSAVSFLTDAGRLTQAAKMSKEVAELYENEELEDPEKSAVVSAIDHYQQAAELFALEEAKSSASQCWIKVAELCSAALEPPDLIRAAGLYEDQGRNCLDSNLLKYNAKTYFLQAVLCHLANNDSVAARQSLEKYEGLDYTFGDSREGKFANQLIECVESMDPEALGTACFEYDRISKLDPWKTSMLVRVKRSIDDEGGDEDDDDFDLT